MNEICAFCREVIHEEHPPTIKQKYVVHSHHFKAMWKRLIREQLTTRLGRRYEKAYR